MNKSVVVRTLAILTICVTTSSCLKTRAQLREESHNGYDSSTPVSSPQPAQVRDVANQGAYALDEVKGELTRLNGRIEDLERANKDNSANGTTPSKDDLKKLETRIMELEQAQANLLEAFKKIQDVHVAAADPLDAFNAGKSSFEAQNYDTAIDELGTYLKAPKGKHAEEATYLRGEAYFQLKQYKKAIVDFSKFPEKYTRSKIMPHALLRIAQSFDALGMKEDASGFYQELTDKYPKSAETKKARARLR